MADGKGFLQFVIPGMQVPGQVKISIIEELTRNGKISGMRPARHGKSKATQQMYRLLNK